MNCPCSSTVSTCPCPLSTHCPFIYISVFRVRTIIIIIIIRLGILICSPSLRPGIQLLLINITTVRSFPFLFFLFFSLLLLHRPRLIPPLNASLSSCSLSSSSFLTSCSLSYTSHPSLSYSQSFNNDARICLNGGSARLVLGRPCSK